MNRLTITGNLGSDPEMRYTQSGAAIANFPVAVNERWTNSAGERQERTTWVPGNRLERAGRGLPELPEQGQQSPRRGVTVPRHLAGQ